jgi:predicted DNA-binding ribbon-helix-helix protein
LSTESERPRNVTIFGRRTSMRLEPAYREALAEIAGRENTEIDRLLDKVAKAPHRGNLTSAIRLFVLAYFRGSAWPPRRARARPQRAPVKYSG